MKSRCGTDPRVEEISLQFDYPDYTGLDQLTSDGASTERNLGGHVKVPVGTIVYYEATTSIPVKAIFVEEYSRGRRTAVGSLGLGNRWREQARRPVRGAT